MFWSLDLTSRIAGTGTVESIFMPPLGMSQTRIPFQHDQPVVLAFQKFIGLQMSLNLARLLIYKLCCLQRGEPSLNQDSYCSLKTINSKGYSIPIIINKLSTVFCLEVFNDA